ncbi:unnamed protein product [Polarella glacialis]|uniref:UDP-galactose translocator n=1 Tax=Polarella glacialis TaxID=89957 RepID=A0A813G393_POLGL|nr:unnamed protein product [Polarella glacialis]
MRYSRLVPDPSSKDEAVPVQLYLVTTAVICGEVLKLIVSGLLALQEMPAREVMHGMFNVNAFAMLLPAALYTLQNNLQYVAVSNLDVSVCQVSSQMKLVTTALFSVALLGRQLTGFQWVGIACCALGVALVQLSTFSAAGGKSQGGGPQGEAWIGFVAVTVACLTSGLAAVVTEKLFKSGNTSLWVRNMHLAFWSLVAGVGGMAFSPDGAAILEKGFFVGYSPLVLLVISLQALGGMAVAMVAKYADNIAKGFATAVSIIATCAFSVVYFSMEMNIKFSAGTFLVLCSIAFYIAPARIPGGPKTPHGMASSVDFSLTKKHSGGSPRLNISVPAQSGRDS